MPNKPADVLENEYFIFTREPRANRWVLYRAADGAEIAEAKTLHGLMEQASAYIAAEEEGDV